MNFSGVNLESRKIIHVLTRKKQQQKNFLNKNVLSQAISKNTSSLGLGLDLVLNYSLSDYKHVFFIKDAVCYQVNKINWMP